MLPIDGARLFFLLMLALQVFGNQKLKIVKHLQNIEQYKKISNETSVRPVSLFYVRQTAQPGRKTRFERETLPEIRRATAQKFTISAVFISPQPRP